MERGLETVTQARWNENKWHKVKFKLRQQWRKEQKHNFLHNTWNNKFWNQD